MEQWTSILHLATKWRFDTMRHAAIHGLQDVSDPIEKIRLWQKYNIKNYWVLGAFTDACIREECLSIEEGRILGIENIVLIAQVRERLRNCACRATDFESVTQLRDSAYDILKETLPLIRPG
jgi:hypothetical protein